MRNTVIDRIARLLILGALAMAGVTGGVMGTAATLSAQTFGIPNGPNDVKTFRGTEGEQGLCIPGGNFQVDEGFVNVYAEGYDHAQRLCGAGILLGGTGSDGGNFVQRGGQVSAYGVNGGDGIVVNDGDYILDGGLLDAWGEGKIFEPDLAGNRIAIVGNSIFVIGGGTDYYGCGVVLKDGDFIQSGGELYARNGNGGAGIVIENGNFIQNGGRVYLVPSDADGLAAIDVAGNARFGAESNVLVELNPQQNIGGLMLVAGNTVIEEGAKLDVCVGHTAALLKDAPLTADFLRTEKSYDDPFAPAPLGTIQGEFNADGTDTLTLHYSIEKSADARQYSATLVREADVSEILDGNNAGLAQSLENVLRSPIGDSSFLRIEALHDLYSHLDLSTSQAEMNAIARSMTAWQATKFAQISVGHVDMMQAELGRNLSVMYSARSVCGPCADLDGCDDARQNSSREGRQFWFAGLGSFGHYGAGSASFADLNVDSFGMNVGMGRSLKGFGRNAVAGIAFNYTHGNVDGEGVDTDYDHFGFLGTVKADLRRFRGWGELSFGYAGTVFNQGRYDYHGNRLDSEVDNDTIRLGVNFGRTFARRSGWQLTPMAGLQYTLVHQGDYSESDRSFHGLTVDGDDLNSLQLRFGLEGGVKRKNLEFSGHGFLRCEMMDRAMTLDARFTGVPPVYFRNKGDNVDRLSGVTGFRLDWHLSSHTDLSAVYDLTVGDRYTEQWVNLGLRRSW